MALVGSGRKEGIGAGGGEGVRDVDRRLWTGLAEVVLDGPATAVCLVGSLLRLSSSSESESDEDEDEELASELLSTGS